jgi:hypothetical protein
MWYPLLIVVLLGLGIGVLQNIMNLLLDAVDPFNKFGFSMNLGMNMGGLFLCSCNGKNYANYIQWLEPQKHLKTDVANRFVNRFVVAMLNIRKVLIPCEWIFGIVHP